MARKYEFKPDKSRSGFFSNLYLTQKQRQQIAKWFLYALLLIVLSVLQDVIFCRMRFFRATTDLVPVGIFLICILEGMHGGCIFTLLAACVYQFSGTAPEPYCIALIVVLAVFVTYFRQSFLQSGFNSAMLCAVAAVFAYEMAIFGVSLFMGLTVAKSIFVPLLTAVLTSLAAPVIYFAAEAIGRIGGEAWKE